MTIDPDGIPAIPCERCGRMVPYDPKAKANGYRIHIKPNIDRARGSVGIFVCNPCADSFGVWSGQYEASAATGEGPEIIHADKSN